MGPGTAVQFTHPDKVVSIIWCGKKGLAACVDSVQRHGSVPRPCCILSQLSGSAIEGHLAQLNFRIALLYVCSTYHGLAAPFSEPQGTNPWCSDDCRALSECERFAVVIEA